MNRKIAFGIVLFVGIGLFMFTFANPNDKVDNNSGSAQENITTNEVQNNETDNVEPVINLADPTNTEAQAPAVDNGNANVPAPVVPNNVVDNTLADAKTNAIEELKNYKNDYDYPNKEDYNNIVNKYVDEINNASTVEDVNKALKDGKTAIDTLISKIETAKAAEELAKYKENAEEIINEYAKDIDLDETKKEEIIADASKKIDEATTKEEVDGIVEDAEASLDEASLDEYKEAAIKDLKKYKKEEKYTEENQTVVNGIKETGITNITNAESKEEVSNILTEAKEDIDNVPVLTYIVTFVDFFNNETKEEVTHDTLVTAPVFKDVVERNITRKFIGWDKDLNKVVTDNMVVTAQYEITKVEAKIYMLHDGVAVPANGGAAGTENYDFKTKIELDLTKESVRKTIIDRINKDRAKVMTLDETEIENMVSGTLPYTDDSEYIYTYYVLKFVKNDGFHIDYYRTVNEAPVITLTGDKVIEVYEHKGHYNFTKGFSVSDDHTTLTNSDVSIEIIKNGVAQVEKINYEKHGTYVIYYTATDAEGNVTTVTRTVKVLKNELKSVALASNNDTYEYGAELDLKVNGTYANGDVKEVEYTINGFNTNVVGKASATVTVNGFDPLTYNYEVSNKLVGITLSNNNDTYEYGESLSLSVDANYVDGTVDEDVEYIINKFENTSLGSHSATVSYEGMTETYSYTIVNKLVSVELSSNEDTYEYGASLNLKVNGTYANGDVKEVEYSITNFDTSIIGSSVAYVTVEGFETIEYIYAVDDKVVDLVLSSNNDSYDYGASLNLSVTAVYVSGAEISNVEYAVANFNNTTVGNGTATVSYEGFTKEYKYTILNKLVRLALSSNDDVYLRGSGMKALSVTAYYINGAEVPNVPYTIDLNTPFNTATTGNKTMTIYAEGQPLTYSYKVNYSDAELANLFKDAKATLPCNIFKWKFWIEFKNLPVGATVVSVKREDVAAANLIDIGSTTKFRLKDTEYADLRDNGGHPITVVYEINGQQFAKVYKERFGTIKV